MELLVWLHSPATEGCTALLNEDKVYFPVFEDSYSEGTGKTSRGYKKLTNAVIWSFRSSRGCRRPLIFENQPESWGRPCGIEMDRVPVEQDFLVVGVVMSVIM